MQRSISSIIVLFAFFLLMNMQSYAFEISDLKWAKDVGAQKSPQKTTLYKVADYGAKADGVTLNTVAIQKAIDACAAAGGGIVSFDRGKYLTGSIYVKENVHLQIPKGTTLLGSTDIEDYPEIDTRVAGIEMRWPSALINILNQKNVMVSGDGIVHGQGKVFWDKYWEMRKDYTARGLRWIVDYDCKRPRTFLVSESSDVTLKGITFQQAGFWTVQLLYSSYCTVDGVVIQNNLGGHGPSTDGVDIDSSDHILVENCDIDCNDDNFCLKAGRDADGLRVNRPTEYVVIRNCVSRAGGGLFTCGSETSGGIRYILAHGLKAQGTNVGIRLKSAMNRGGTTEHIYVKDVEMENVGTAFEATMNWHPAYSYSTLPTEMEGKTLPDHWTKMLEKVSEEDGTPYFNNIYLSDFRIKHATTFINVEGSDKSTMRKFSFENIRVNADNAGTVNHAADWSLKDVDIRTKDNSVIKVSYSSNVTIPTGESFVATDFPNQLPAYNEKSLIWAADFPEFGFCLPEMTGNLKFGVIVNGESKWVRDFKNIDIKKNGAQLVYTLNDPILKSGSLTFRTVSLNNTNGIVLQVDNEKLPHGAQLFWSYGGASGRMLKEGQTPSLYPAYCKYNVFNVEQTAFTLYYGKETGFSIIKGVAPVSSEIQLSDAYSQQSPITFFRSGKDTVAQALAATLPLVNGQKEYFCIYKQGRNTDYAYYMLPAIFEKESENNNLAVK